MSTLKIDELKNNGSAIDLPNGIKVGGKEIVQGYTSSGTEPASPAKGDFWWDSTNELLYQYVNGEFKAIGVAAVANWTVDLSNVTYDSVSFSLSSQATTVLGLAFNPDGTKMYVPDGNSPDTLYQYSLSTGFDISTATYNGVSLNVASQDSSPQGVAFNSDGTKMYLDGSSSSSIYQYSLTTGFDISTATYDSVSFSVSSQDATPSGVTFDPSGTKMYITGQVNDAVYQYTLSTAFDLSTASYDSVSFSVASQDTIPNNHAFNPDGTKMYVTGQSSDNVHQYTLSTGFDLSTASYDNVSFSVFSQESAPRGLAFSSDGTKMYIAGFGSDTVFQYSTGL